MSIVFIENVIFYAKFNDNIDYYIPVVRFFIKILLH